MSIRIMAVCAFGLLLGACSDNPYEPTTPKEQTYSFPAAVQNLTSSFSASSSGPRVEVYTNGIMRSVFKGDGSQPATTADLALPETAASDLIRLASRPLNKRTKHFADLLLTVARAPEASRGQAMRAVSRQLLRETEHRDTTLADGSRILEYYFDHQLATRVVLPASTSSKRRVNLPQSSGSTPFGLTTEVIGETCTEGCEGAGVYDPVYDAELWVSVAWYADQTQAMIDISSVEGDESGLYLVIYEKKCIGEIGSWASSVFSIGFGIGKLSEGWATISLITKQGGVIGLGSMFAGAVNAWNNMHNCFHP